jgi:hypothetical protein
MLQKILGQVSRKTSSRQTKYTLPGQKAENIRIIGRQKAAVK